MNEVRYEWPDTEHPSLAPVADNIRAALNHGQDRAYKVARIRRMDWSADAPPLDDVAFRTELLTVRQARGAAPYVGRPFVYVWKVAVGEGGRWIAGSVRIEYVDAARPWPRRP